LNIDDATLYRFYNKRTVEIRIGDSLKAFVATSAEKAYSVFYKLTEYIIRRWTFISFFSDQTGHSRPEAALVSKYILKAAAAE
jgi:hypothetical protein